MITPNSALGFHFLSSRLLAYACSTWSTRSWRWIFVIGPSIQDIHHETTISEILFKKIRKPFVSPQALLMRGEMCLGYIAKTAICWGRGSVDSTKCFSEADNFPIILKSLQEFFPHNLFQELHIEVVGKLIDFGMNCDSTLRFNLVIALVHIAEDLVEDIRIHLFKLDVLRLTFLSDAYVTL